MQELPQLPVSPGTWSPTEIATWLWQILSFVLVTGGILFGVVVRKWMRDYETRENDYKSKIAAVEKEIRELATADDDHKIRLAQLEVEKRHLEQQLAQCRRQKHSKADGAE